MTFEPMRGVIAPILTPFNDDMSIATDLYVDLAKHLFDEGCVGLAPFGTTGEALSVGIDERIFAISALVDGGIEIQVEPDGPLPFRDGRVTDRDLRHGVEVAILLGDGGVVGIRLDGDDLAIGSHRLGHHQGDHSLVSAEVENAAARTKPSHGWTRP